MKRIITSLVFILIAFIASSQDKNNIKIQMRGYKENDTVRIDDLLKIKDIFLCNKNYPVVSFVFVYTYGLNDFMMISNSNNLTEDMKNRLIKFRSMNVAVMKISFKAITVVTPQNEQIKTSPSLKFILRIK